jgi:UDP-glucose-4-epimerase GalE
VADQGTVLVTGGAGYIGSHTVRALREAGRDVVVLDSLELGRREAVIDSPLVVGNITDQDLVSATCNEHGVTQVVHFAAYKSVGESMGKPDKYWRNNVAGTVELVEAMLAADVHDIVFSSSCSVYGNPAVVPVTEDAAIAPESIYAESKAMVEKILGWYGKTSELRSVSLRYFNAAGASHDGRIGEDWSFSINLIPLVMKALLLENHTLKVFGDDYDTPDGTGRGSSVLEVVRAFEAASGRQVPYRVEARRPGDVAACYADPSLAHRLLGWRARLSLADMCAHAWAWQRDNPRGYSN